MKKLILSVSFLMILISAKAHSVIDSIESVPFRIERFTAIEKSNSKIELNFTVAELFLIVSKYEIWKSTDNVNFVLAGVAVRTSMQPTAISYQVIDELTSTESKAKIVYYKLRQVTVEGHYTEGTTLAVKLKAGTEDRIKVWPNPVVKECTISLGVTKNCICELELYNSTGVLIKKETIAAIKGIQNIKWEFNNEITAGIYLLKSKINGTVVQTKKLIKQ